MGGQYCAINSPLGPRWGQKSLDLRSRDFCPHLGPRGELIAQYRLPMSFRYITTRSPAPFDSRLRWLTQIWIFKVFMQVKYRTMGNKVVLLRNFLYNDFQLNVQELRLQARFFKGLVKCMSRMTSWYEFTYSYLLKSAANGDSSVINGPDFNMTISCPIESLILPDCFSWQQV